MFNCFPDADARAQARVGPGLATPLAVVTRFLCFLYSSNLLTEPVCLYVLKREFLLFIALSNIEESQGRCFFGRSHFLGIQMSNKMTVQD